MSKILIADDDALFRQSVVNIFAENHEVDEASTSDEADNLTTGIRHDLIILDYNIQPANGLHILKTLRSRGINCPVILITGYGTFEIAIEALEQDVFHILPKPVSLVQLENAVSEALQYEALMRRQAAPTYFPALAASDVETVPHHVLEAQYREIEKIRHLLAYTRNQFTAVFNSVADPILILNKQLRVVGANQAALSMSGQSLDMMINRRCADLLSDDQSHFCNDCPSRRAFTIGQTAQTRKSCQRLGKTFEIIAYPVINDDNGEVTNVIELRRDITASITAEEQIAQAKNHFERMNIASEVGHELNNMLTIVKAYAGLCGDSMQDGDIPGAVNSFTKLSEGIGRLELYASQLLQNHFKKHTPAHLNLVSLINNSIDFIKPQTLFRRTTFVLDWPDRDLVVFADEAQLQQIFINLFKNAAEACPTVSIHVSATIDPLSNSVLVRVRDNGPGIPPHIMNGLFSERVTTKPDGHGFGLLIIQRLVKQNDGRIAAASSPGNGSTFTIQLPVSETIHDKTTARNING
jgi:PAS domain S-box-containing protein